MHAASFSPHGPQLQTNMLLTVDHCQILHALPIQHWQAVGQFSGLWYIKLLQGKWGCMAHETNLAYIASLNLVDPTQFDVHVRGRCDVRDGTSVHIIDCLSFLNIVDSAIINHLVPGSPSWMKKRRVSCYLKEKSRSAMVCLATHPPHHQQSLQPPSCVGSTVVPPFVPLLWGLRGQHWLWHGIHSCLATLAQSTMLLPGIPSVATCTRMHQWS